MLGFVREMAMAYFFGTSLAKSAFDVAFKLPNLFRSLFGEGALSAALVPVFTETLHKDGREEAGVLASRVLTALAFVLSAIAVLTVGAISIYLWWGDPGVKASAVLPLLRILFPYMVFICLVAGCMAVLNSLHSFVMPAMCPVILNVVWIVTLVGVSPLVTADPAGQVAVVAWGIVVAGALQLAILIAAVCRAGIRLRVRSDWRDPRILSIMSLMGPAALGMGVHQVNVMIDGILAMWVGTWAPAALTYAERLVYLPLGVFATALGTVLLPTYSRQAAENQHDRIADTMAQSLRVLMLVMMPAAVGLVALARPIVELVFVWKGGAFRAESIDYTTRALWFYAPGLVVFSVGKLVVPAFYALKDMRTPVRLGLLAVGLNLVMNIAFVLTWPEGYGHAGLACATVLASMVNGVMLVSAFHRAVGFPAWRAVLATAGRTLAASVVMAAVVLGLYHTLLGPEGAQDRSMIRLLATIGGLGGGVVAYVLMALVLCRPEIALLRQGRGGKGRSGTGGSQ
jgi:putative peptidoglycan lipid II flippase